MLRVALFLTVLVVGAGRPARPPPKPPPPPAAPAPPYRLTAPAQRAVLSALTEGAIADLYATGADGGVVRLQLRARGEHLVQLDGGGPLLTLLPDGGLQ